MDNTGSQESPQQEEYFLQEQRQGGHKSSTAGGETLCEENQLYEKGGAEIEKKNNMREVWPELQGRQWKQETN